MKVDNAMVVKKAANGWTVTRNFLVDKPKPIGLVGDSEVYVARNDEELIDLVRMISAKPLIEQPK